MLFHVICYEMMVSIYPWYLMLCNVLRDDPHDVIYMVLVIFHVIMLLMLCNVIC